MKVLTEVIGGDGDDRGSEVVMGMVEELVVEGLFTPLLEVGGCCHP